MILTRDQLTRLLPTNHKLDDWLPIVNDMLPRYGIDTPVRVANFMAQCAHESGDFTVTQENLNYSAQGLANTWPNRYATKDVRGNLIQPITPNEIANELSRKPDQIANNVYANRLGNGDEASGDGSKYRGRGLIQLTGKNNYQEFAGAIGKSLDDTSQYMQTPEGACESACFFWKKHNINKFADLRDVYSITKIINGGMIGLLDRKAKLQTALVTLTQ